MAAAVVVKAMAVPMALVVLEAVVARDLMVGGLERRILEGVVAGQ
jgi:hypothetical protein